MLRKTIDGWINDEDEIVPFRDGIEPAQPEPKRKRKPCWRNEATQRRRIEMAELYKEGKDILDISVTMGLSIKTVYAGLAVMGLRQKKCHIKNS
ncbi:MAG: hypothetical protein WC616_01480 [Candidatus Omnitrophota bacterium]